MPRTVHKYFLESRNFCFKCDACVAECYKPLESKIKNIESEFSELKDLLKSLLEDPTSSAALTSRNVVETSNPGTTRRRRKKVTKKINLAVTPTVTVTDDASNPQFSTPIATEIDEDFLTPLPPSPKKRPTTKGFFGTAGETGQIAAAEERKVFVISRVHPATTTEGIADFIKQHTDTENVRCQLMLPRGRTAADLDFVSFKVSATAADYTVLMRPEIWPSKVLVRDFVQTNRRRGGRGVAAGFHRF
jgi:hypothetical protein